jgi:hypothetical protein
MCRYMEIVLEDILKEHNWTMHNYDDIMQKVNKTETGPNFVVIISYIF